MSDDVNGRILTALDSLQAGQAKLDAGQTRLEEGQVKLRVELMGRMDRLQDVITGLREDVAVNFGRADKAELAAHNVREEVRALGEVVSAMHRQIQRLQTDVRHLKGEP